MSVEVKDRDGGQTQIAVDDVADGYLGEKVGTVIDRKDMRRLGNVQEFRRNFNCRLETRHDPAHSKRTDMIVSSPVHLRLRRRAHDHVGSVSGLRKLRSAQWRPACSHIHLHRRLVRVRRCDPVDG